jgi:hypothetical protein
LRSIPTILPQSASPHWAIATTPWPFAVDQLPRGRWLSICVADAGDAIRPIASIAAPPSEVSDLMYLDIEAKSVCSCMARYGLKTTNLLRHFTSKDFCID